ncbi:ABC transporter permease [Microbacterium invictum]|uniref:Peptide/nickel transport system permease protein n=1 Tax=Microbacterium invictum TaxID=515415 RepID=A0AA40VN27_9MICO|nr:MULTISPECIES: ABC transporter permease [Microbacterium]MBB4139953.1 peptide/nickel transport system permease protein [Microbacterium invictum]
MSQLTADAPVAAVAARRPRNTRRLAAFDIAALAFLLVLAVAVAAPGLLSPYDPLEVAPGQTLQSPSLTHLFGTDYLGRDLYTRVVHGTGRTLLASFIAVVIGLGVGSLLGLIAAYFGRTADTVISRIVDVLLSIPGLLLSMVIVVALGFGSVNAAIAVGIASVAMFARLMRSEVLRVRALTFVESARHLGVRPVGVLWHHVLPNSYGPVLSMTTLQFGASILWIAALSFLGYGAPPPQPEWGLLVAEGREYISSNPTLTLLPGLVIILTVLSISRVSRLLSHVPNGADA